MPSSTPVYSTSVLTRGIFANALDGNWQLMAYIAIAAACVVWIIARLVFSQMSKLPGPWYTNLLGVMVIYHDFQGSKRLWIHKLHLKYGPVVRLGPREASFASPTALKEIYVSGGGYVKTELYSLFRQGGYTNLFTALDKKEHNEKKKRFADRYSNTAVLKADVQAPLQDRARAFVDVCAKYKVVDIYCYLHCYALDCVSAMAFHPFGTKSIEGGLENEMVQKLSYHDSRANLAFQLYFPWLASVYNNLHKPAEKIGHTIVDYANTSMSKARHADFTLATRLREHPGMGEESMVSECLDHIGAGIDTTGDALCFLLWELAQPRNVARMKRLREELLTCRPENGGRLETLEYLNAVIEETMRLWAPGTLPLPRYVPQGGRIIDSYFIPGGTTVSAQSYTVHRLDESTFPEAYDFVPERWLQEKGKAERQRQMFAFGAGARTCIGKFLALSEMRLLIHGVVSRFDIKPAPDMAMSSMEMSDQLITSRPKDMVCKLEFIPV